MVGIVEPDLLEETALFFKVLGDPTRLRIVYELYRVERSVNEIATSIGLSLSAVSHQLALLKRAKLVASRREGRLVFYRLSDEHVATIVGNAQEHFVE